MSFREFEETGEWSVIREAIAAGFDRARHYAETLSRIFLEGEAKDNMVWVQAQVERSLLAPLNIRTE